MRKLMRNVSAVFILLLILFWFHPMKSQDKGASVKPETITFRLGSLIKVRPEYEERYIILHKHVFPGVLDRIRRSNLRNYSIFLKDGILFSYFEYVGADYNGDMKAIADTTTKEWWKLTDPMQEPLPTRKKGEWWASMEEVFAADTSVVPQIEVQRLAYVSQAKSKEATGLADFFKENGAEILPFLRKAHLGNVHIYFKDGSLYSYSEYDGAHWNSDLQSLKDDPAWAKLNDRLNAFLKAPWQEMKIVFHTN
ncbi:MAG TPA: L-rhamnose mutarotase [Bacteroidota bacterium]|nr:L-rhamnose mutarotase [Bacteroidota bacterium]